MRVTARTSRRALEQWAQRGACKQRLAKPLNQADNSSRSSGSSASSASGARKRGRSSSCRARHAPASDPPTAIVVSFPGDVPRSTCRERRELRAWPERRAVASELEGSSERRRRARTRARIRRAAMRGDGSARVAARAARAPPSALETTRRERGLRSQLSYGRSAGLDYSRAARRARPDRLEPSVRGLRRVRRSSLVAAQPGQRYLGQP